MVSVRPVMAALCATLVLLLCLVPHSSAFVLERMTRQAGSEQCSVGGVCAFESYNGHTIDRSDTCTCPSDTSCERHYNNLATGVWNYRCLSLGRVVSR